jgi:hypothetical protein
MHELELPTIHSSNGNESQPIAKSSKQSQYHQQQLHPKSLPDREEDFNGDHQVIVVPFSPDDSQEHIAKMIDQSVDHHHFYSDRQSLSMPMNLEEQFNKFISDEQQLQPPSSSLPVEEGHGGGKTRGITRRGSNTGLTQESSAAVAWIHVIPWQLKPAIPGFFNLCNAALRWGSLFYVTASICDMLMSGSELVLSVVAARVIRKRQISGTRWAGVAVIAIGLLTVRAADVLDSDAEMATMDADEAARLKRDHFIGAVLIVGQSLTAICQDMAEELFLQEADFPATLLLGMEGMFGLFFGIPFYLLYATETPSEIWATLQSSVFKKCYVIGLICLFTVTGIFNIMATGVTSSMTRNMWKNFRTILVWVLGLIIYYGWGNVDLGEAWIIPVSFFTLFGFLIMLSGIYVYYKHK